MVTWSKDQHLRLWPIEPRDLKGVTDMPSGLFESIVDEGIAAASPRDSASSQQLSVSQSNDSEIISKFREMDFPLPIITEATDGLVDYYWEQLKTPDLDFKEVGVDSEIQDIKSKMDGIEFQRMDPLIPSYR